jgi:hypothetical protein
LKSLLRTAPLHALRSSKASALLPHDDVAALCMKALEILIDALGLRPGATREEIEQGLFPLLNASDGARHVAPSGERHHEVVGLVLGALLNDDNRRQAYIDDYLDFDGGMPVVKRLTFRLASEQEALDGAIVIRAETDGINLFLRSLDIPLEDAQAATEAVIRSQLERNQLDLAVQSAREAQIRSLQYQSYIEATLRRTERDVGRVDWRHEVPVLLDEALAHVRGRLEAERQIMQCAEDSLDQLAGGEKATKLVTIRDMLLDCQKRHLSLQGPLMRARHVFLDEQARQRFAPVPMTSLPALEEDLLAPILVLSSTNAQKVCGAFTAGAAAAEPPLLLDLHRLWDRLLQPPRTPSLTGPEIEDALHALDLPPPRFDEPLGQRVDELLKGIAEPVTLSWVIDQLQTRPEAQFAVLRCLQHFAPDANPPLPIDVDRHGNMLERMPFLGDELWIRPASRTPRA